MAVTVRTVAVTSALAFEAAEKVRLEGKPAGYTEISYRFCWFSHSRRAALVCGQGSRRKGVRLERGEGGRT